MHALIVPGAAGRDHGGNQDADDDQFSLVGHPAISPIFSLIRSTGILAGSQSGCPLSAIFLRTERGLLGLSERSPGAVSCAVRPSSCVSQTLSSRFGGKRIGVQRAMPDTFDPYREALVMETRTIWPEGYENWDDAKKSQVATRLHADPAEASNLAYVRVHSGFCRQITVTDDDVQRVGG